ncbi:copper uptake system-associated protein [Sedimentitalea sp.]|uniref:copper uptake system-associated protein n=1 Tax=Sedimentitalea sp. TaxID=2048915 RepID=UPI003298393C
MTSQISPASRSSQHSLDRCVQHKSYLRLGGFFATLPCTALPAAAHEFFLGDLQIIHPSIPATPRDTNSAAVYMALANDGTKDERLLGIETPFGKVRFVHPVTSADGMTTMQERAWIDIPAGEVVLLSRGDLRGSLASVNRPLFEGGELTGTMIFQDRGRFDMFFMLDPMEAETEYDPVTETTRQSPQIDRAAAIADITSALRNGLGRADATVAPIAFAGDAAIAGWMSGTDGAWVFLRKGAQGWQVELMSNDSLLLPATLTSLGVPRRDSAALLAEIAAQEDALGPDFAERLDAFAGTAYLQPSSE